MSAPSPAFRAFDVTMAAAAAGRNVADWCPGDRRTIAGGEVCTVRRPSMTIVIVVSVGS